MTETAPEPEVAPEPTEAERVARLAAEAAVRALPDLNPRLTEAEAALQQILQALAAAAGPDGNAARLGTRLDAVERTLAGLTAAPAPLPEGSSPAELSARLAVVERTLAGLNTEPEAHPGQQRLIDDLRLKVAGMERDIKLSRKDNP